MYNLYLKIASRFLLKNKLYSFINIMGLSVGIASFVLIMMYVANERNYDKFNGSENVYRVYMDYLEGNTFSPGDAQSYNLSGPTLKKEFPEIKEYVRFFHLQKTTFINENEVFEGNKGAIVDPSFFSVFDYPLVKGDVKDVLAAPNSIVLQENLAKKIFGKESPIGKTLSIFWKGETTVTVTGILKDIPKNTHIKNNFLVSFETLKTWKAIPRQYEPNWSQNNFFTYIKVNKNTDIDALQQKIIKTNFEDDLDERHNIESLESIHLNSNKPYEAEANGSESRVKFLLAIAFIILILSWLNYVNLATTKSLERAKEIGIRKVSGAQRPQLIFQSLLESVLINCIAIVIATIVVVFTLPFFNSYTGEDLIVNSAVVLGLLPYLGFIFLGTVLSGLYPAIILSGYSPVVALKGKVRASSNGLNIRKGLIITQFFATIVLLIGTIVVAKQIKFLENQPIGANLDHVVAFNWEVLNKSKDSVLKRDNKLFESELRKLPYVKNVVSAETYPGGGYDNLSSTVGITFPNGTVDESRIFYTYNVSPGYFNLLDMEFVAGSSFLETAKRSSNKIVINEKMAKHMQIANLAEAVDETVKFWGEDWVISGVIKDYHHFGLKTAIEPILIRHYEDKNNLLVKFDKSVTSVAGFGSVLKKVENIWDNAYAQNVFNYTFLDKEFQSQYNEDKNFGSAFLIFTVLAILIASMGLFGLTSYTVVQRRKEIGVRKVNGANIVNILATLNKDFVKWIMLAFIVAVPISWFTMLKWLEGFAYKTAISWWVFAVAGCTALVIALLTVSWQSLKAALANPVDALKDE
ncbi:ABC transporter permease [Cellulophaga fucicola]|uniref:ABC transporter permease n=1 Tax=Cellulophaga fucicola TaxID=76595 RepID=UPI003EBEC2D6